MEGTVCFKQSFTTSKRGNIYTIKVVTSVMFKHKTFLLKFLGFQGGYCSRQSFGFLKFRISIVYSDVSEECAISFQQHIFLQAHIHIFL
jgi:hypothetical protein